MTPTPFGFAGQHDYQSDPDSALMKLGHRYYGASTGRFLSRDPIQDGYNWYAYCDNDPVNAVDPEGLAKIWVRFRRLGVNIFQAFIIVEDEQKPGPNNLWYIRGDKDRWAITPDLVVTWGDYQPNTPDWLGGNDRSPGGPAPILIRDDNLPADFWKNWFKQVGRDINNENITYGWIGDNSSSTVTTILDDGTLPFPAAPVPWPNAVPGWGTILPH